MKIAIEYINWLTKERYRINQVPIEEMVFFENGMKLDIPQQLIDEFSFIGLNNIDFITTGFYRGKGLETQTQANKPVEPTADNLCLDCAGRTKHQN